MRIVRSLAAGCLVAACTAVIALVSADRLAHSLPAPAPRAAAVEPSTTGSIPRTPSPSPAAKAAASAIPNGFDTERLNALMRGDPILPGKR